MSLTLPAGMQINAPLQPGYETILTPEALELVAKLHRAFEPRRQELLKARVERTWCRIHMKRPPSNPFQRGYPWRELNPPSP